MYYHQITTWKQAIAINLTGLSLIPNQLELQLSRQLLDSIPAPARVAVRVPEVPTATARPTPGTAKDQRPASNQL